MGCKLSRRLGAGVDGLGADVRSDMAEIWSGVTETPP